MPIKLGSIRCSSCHSVRPGSSFAAGNPTPPTAPAEEPHEQSWYREQQQTAKPDAKAIVQQKAQFRAEQRMSRMASMESNSKARDLIS